MRITIEPTAAKNQEDIGIPLSKMSEQWAVQIEHPADDLNLFDTIHLISRALVAYGFSGENVREYFEEISERDG